MRFTAGEYIRRVHLCSGVGSHLPNVPADGLGSGGAPELLSLVFPGGSSVPRTAAPGAGVDSGTNTCGVSGTGWAQGKGTGAEWR